MKAILLKKLRQEAKYKVRIRKRSYEYLVIGTRKTITKNIGSIEDLEKLFNRGDLSLMLLRARREYILNKTEIIRKKRDKKMGNQLYQKCRKL